MVASGTRPARALAPVTAYLDFVRFRTLPRVGGTFDQPAQLMEELRVVADIVAHEQGEGASDAPPSAEELERMPYYDDEGRVHYPGES